MRAGRRLFYIKFADYDNQIRGLGLLGNSNEQWAKFKHGVVRITREHLKNLKEAGIEFERVNS